MGTGSGKGRRGWRAILGVAAVLALMTSCGDERDRVVRLKVGTFWGGVAAEALGEEIRLACQGVEAVEAEIQLFNMSSLHERLLSEGGPDPASDLDLALIPNDWFGVLTERALIGELPAQQANVLREHVVTEALLAVSQDDRLFGYPISAEVLVLVYNPRLLPREPRSLDDLFSAPLAPGVVPFSIDLANIYHLTPLLASYQESMTRPDGSFAWDPAAAARVFRSLAPLWNDPAARSIATATDPASLHVQLFAEERLASFVAGPWLIPALASVGRPYAVAPIPPFRGSLHPARALVGYQSLVVIRQSPWGDLAHNVAMRLLDAESQLHLAARTARLPVVRGAFASGAATANPASLGFLRAMENGQTMPSTAVWEQGFRTAGGRLRAAVRARAGGPLSLLITDLAEGVP
ncbi:MAG: extracellular solute-binding protein [Acidobacteriota bacterium]